MSDKKERGVVRAMVSDGNERGRVITVEEESDNDFVSLVAADGSDAERHAVIVFSLDALSARDLGQALIEAADGLEADDDE